MSEFGSEVFVTHENAHGRPDNLDPKTNGPFLDDIRAEQERAYREMRNAEPVAEEEDENENPEDDENEEETEDVEDSEEEEDNDDDSDDE